LLRIGKEKETKKKKEEEETTAAEHNGLPITTYGWPK